MPLPSSSPASHQVLTAFDPLQPPPLLLPNDSSLPDEPAASTSSAAPISFKRRTPSRSTGARTGLLGGILSRSNEDSVDKVPSPALRRPDAPNRIALPSSPYRSGNDSALDSDDELAEGQKTPTPGAGGRWGAKQRQVGKGVPGRISFGAQGTKQPRFGSKSEENPMSSGGRNRMLEPEGRGSPGGRGGSPGSGGPMSPPLEVLSTPLPTIPIIVLCIAMFGEFLCASTSSPFLYFMDFGVGQGPNGGGEAAVGFWTGIVGAAFFLSQFLTSLLWVSVAEKHGRRSVLFASLLGNALALCAFGTSKNLGTAILCRLAMGLFNGAVGVARSAVQTISDPSNESRALTYMALCWGLGGIVGSVIGGLAENPIRNYPSFFTDSPFLTSLFTAYPYLLPCLLAGSVTFTGAILSLFLSPDGGPREGGIHLPTEKEVERAASSAAALPRNLVKRVSTYFRGDAAISFQSSPPDRVPLHRPGSGLPSPEPECERNPFSLRRSSAKQSGYGSVFNPLAISSLSRRTSGAGSAYGYDSGARFPGGRRNTGRSGFRNASVATTTRYAPDYDDEHQDLTFAQRLLLANDQAIFGISDLWVAQATQADDQFSQVDYDESVFEDDESRLDIDADESEHEPDFFGFGTAPPSLEDLRGQAAQQDELRGQYGDAPRGSPSLNVPRNRSESKRSPSRDRVTSYGGRHRRDSVVSSRGPALFANTGLNPQSLGSAAALLSPPIKDAPEESAFNPMTAIPEMRPASIIEHDVHADVENLEEKVPVPLLRQLPLAMIGQYALLALHGTVCDQIFVSFIVTPVPSGGLGLKAANYALLVSLMFFFSMIWQFRFYGNVGPPGGSLSHLAMFRLGLALYIPVYMLFPELRGLLREDGNNWVMLGMTLLSAVRYLASTCSYTAVMVLINAMSPPHLVPLSNGLAQSAVSLARFVGPILGGTIWAASIADGPNAHPWPFNFAAGFVAISIICGLGFAHSFRIR